MNKVKEMLMNLHSSMAWKLRCQLQVRLGDEGESQQDIIPAIRATIIGDTLLCQSKLPHCPCEGTLLTLLSDGRHSKSVKTKLKTLCWQP